MQRIKTSVIEEASKRFVECTFGPAGHDEGVPTERVDLRCAIEVDGDPLLLEAVEAALMRARDVIHHEIARIRGQRVQG